jgi:malate/lactate dehydrogenase
MIMINNYVRDTFSLTDVKANVYKKGNVGYEVIDGLVVGYPVKIGSEKHYYLILVLLSRAYRADADNTVSLCS